jgi:tripartite-type tricarboxylate transporter receptor subunit TctC
MRPLPSVPRDGKGPNDDRPAGSRPHEVHGDMEMNYIRRMVSQALVAVALMSSGASAQAADFPAHTVSIVVPYPAGGGTDILARKMAKILSEHWRVPVVVENVAGAEGLIGTERVLRAPADGYTMLFQISQMMLWKKTLPASRVDVLKDFRYVSKIQTSPLAFGVSPKIPVKTFGEFVQWCKANANGCAWGSGSTYAQLIGRQLMDIVGLRASPNIPYKGTAPMMTDVAGGHIAMAVPAVTSSLPQIKGGLFHLLAVGSDKRSTLAPEVPTLRESGYAVHGETWYGMLVAKGTPQQAFDKIVEGIQFASRDASLVAQIRNDGGDPIFSSPAAFEEDVKRESQQLDVLLDKYWDQN